MRYSTEAVEEAVLSAQWSLGKITPFILSNPGQQDFEISKGKIDSKITTLHVSIESDKKGAFQRKRLSVSQVRLDRIRRDQQPILRAMLNWLLPPTQTFSFEEIFMEEGSGGTRRTAELQRNKAIVYRLVTFTPTGNDEVINGYHDSMMPWDSTHLIEMAADITELTKLAVNRRSNSNNDPTFP